MSGPGDAFRSIFEDTLLDLKGVDVLIYDNWQTEQVVMTQTRALKTVKKPYFEMALDTPVTPGNVLQIEGSNDFWRVIDVEDEFKYGAPIKRQVRVTKLDLSGNEVHLDSQGRATFNGPVYGAVQVGGQNNTQAVSMSFSDNRDVEAALHNLVALVTQSSLTTLDQEDVLHEIERVRELSTRPPTPGLAERMKVRLEAIKACLEVGEKSSDLAQKAAPYLAILWQLATSLGQQ
jgi:hypothetical protein